MGGTIVQETHWDSWRQHAKPKAMECAYNLVNLQTQALSLSELPGRQPCIVDAYRENLTALARVTSSHCAPAGIMSPLGLLGGRGKHT